MPNPIRIGIWVSMFYVAYLIGDKIIQIEGFLPTMLWGAGSFFFSVITTAMIDSLRKYRDAN